MASRTRCTHRKLVGYDVVRHGLRKRTTATKDDNDNARRLRPRTNKDAPATFSTFATKKTRFSSRLAHAKPSPMVEINLRKLKRTEKEGDYRSPEPSSPVSTSSDNDADARLKKKLCMYVMYVCARGKITIP